LTLSLEPPRDEAGNLRFTRSPARRLRTWILRRVARGSCTPWHSQIPDLNVSAHPALMTSRRSTQQWPMSK
jgi:hypothetical protein